MRRQITTWARLAILLVCGLTAPLGGVGEQRSGVPLVAVLDPGNPPTAASPGGLNSFRQALRALGYVEGRTIIVESAYAAFHPDRLPALAAELIQRNPAVIVTHTNRGALAAKRATSTVPIVVAVAGDLVELGVVASLAHPGGNITGQIIRDSELAAKRLDWLKTSAPSISQVAWLVQPGVVESERVATRIEQAGNALGMRLQRVEADTPESIDPVLATLTRRRVDALMVQDSFLFYSSRQRIHDFARQHRLATVCGARAQAKAGCLIAYGPDTEQMWGHAATFVDKILKGAKPADLPVELPHKLNLILNRTTAKTLGIKFPPELLALADEIIE